MFSFFYRMGRSRRGQQQQQRTTAEKQQQQRQTTIRLQQHQQTAAATTTTTMEQQQQQQQATVDQIGCAENAAYINELGEIGPYLANLGEFIDSCLSAKRDQTAAEILDILDINLLDSFLASIQSKQHQMDGVRRLLRRNPRFANKELLLELIDGAQPKCRQAFELVARLRCSLLAASDQVSEADVVIQLDSGEEEEDREDERDAEGDGEVSYRPPEDAAVTTPEGAAAALSLMADWRQGVASSDTKSLMIDRSRLLPSIINFYRSRKDDALRQILSVRFEGEPGIDMGALTREFFSLGFEAVIDGTFQNQALFEGERGHLLPYPGTDPRIYQHLGKMIVHAVVNQCKGLHGLSPAIVHYMVSGTKSVDLKDSNPPLCVDDVADRQLREVLRKLEEGPTELSDEEQSILENWMEESYCSIHLTPSAAIRSRVVQHVLMHYVFTKRLAQVDALASGLGALGLRKFLRRNRTKENISFVFPSLEDITISADAILAAIVTRGDPGEGGNVLALDQFVEFVRELEQTKPEGFGISELLRFITSAPYLPPRIVVSFRSDNIRLPMAHVCYNEITLPVVHRNYGDFRDGMLMALRHGLAGFDMA